MNKTELTAEIAAKTKLTKKDCESFLNAFAEVVTDTLAKGGKVQMIGFGSFEVIERSERTGKNPQTGKTITIAAVKAPKFRPGKALKDAVNA